MRDPETIVPWFRTEDQTRALPLARAPSTRKTGEDATTAPAATTTTTTGAATTTTTGDATDATTTTTDDATTTTMIGVTSPMCHGTSGWTTGSRSVSASGWNTAKLHWGSYVGPAIGYLFVYSIISIVLGIIPFLGGLLQIFLLPPLQAGFTLVALRQLDGRPWSFGDFFGGFQYYGAVLALYLLQAVLYAVCFAPALVAFFVLLNMNAPPSEILPVVIGLYVCGMVPAIYLGLRGFGFATQLVFDRDYGPIEAIQGSWHLTSRSFFSILLAAFLLLLLTFMGYLACLVGVLFTMPLAFLAWNAGYLLVAGRDPPIRNPNTYRSRDYDDLDTPRRRLPDDYDRGFRDRDRDDRGRDRDDRDRDRDRDRYRD